VPACTTVLGRSDDRSISVSAGREEKITFRYEQSQGEYGINWVVASGTIPKQGVLRRGILGYKYGGDAIVGNLNAGYKVFGKWHVEGNVFFMAHGTTTSGPAGLRSILIPTSPLLRRATIRITTRIRLRGLLARHLLYVGYRL
jgi:hypothetical protein